MRWLEAMIDRAQHQASHQVADRNSTNHAPPSEAELAAARVSRERLATFRKWVDEKRARAGKGDKKGKKETVPTPCEDVSPDLCGNIGFSSGPEATIFFRQPVTVVELDVALGDPVEGTGPFLSFACVPLPAGSMTADIAIDLRFEQRWYYRRSEIAALSSSVAMAPGETLFLSMRNTQRKQFSRETVDEVERSQQTESTIADKDVLNVTRSSSKTNNWNVSGNASFSMGGFGLGASGSVSETVTDAANSSAQRTSENTRKSASNLKTLQKVQIRESLDVTTEEQTSRTITNPFRDRSLRLDVYELAKTFCVEFHLVDLAPVLILNLKELTFRRDFVLNNGGFLADELIDRLLEVELAEALQLTTNFRPQGLEAKAARTARMALEYLFINTPIFNLPLKTDYTPTIDPNDPATSFVIPMLGSSPHFDGSGLLDASGNKVGVIFTTLAFYYRIYIDHIVPHPTGHASDQLAIDLATSLESALAPRWTGVEETEGISHVLDDRDLTEILRRLGGFLTFASGVLRPLLQTAEEERENRLAVERAEFVVARVEDHLNCHAAYYTERYLHYTARTTQMSAVIELAKAILSLEPNGSPVHLPDVDPEVLADFDAGSVFLDGSRVVIPAKVASSLDQSADLLMALDHGTKRFEGGLLRTEELTIPTDGMHLEPVPGKCVLQGISPEPVSGPIHVAMKQE